MYARVTVQQEVQIGGNSGLDAHADRRILRLDR
jgi:hypothetical protein